NCLSFLHPSYPGAAPWSCAGPRGHPLIRARLALAMSTDEIAADLYLSVNTVKTHLKSVYRKLSVNRRNEAVRRARDLGLL
ncbi:helix-turn-helix transcriptional regulator, partial [Streptomyces sp. NPDC004976]